MQQAETMSMDDLDNRILEELERSSGNSSASSDCSQPSMLDQPTQSPSAETAQQPDSPWDMELVDHWLTYISESVAPSTPITPIVPSTSFGPKVPSTPTTPIVPSTSFGPVVPTTPIAPVVSAGDSTIPYPSANSSLKKPNINRKSKLVRPDASTSSDCADTSNVPAAGAGSSKPYVKIIEEPEPYRRYRYDSEITSAGAIHGVTHNKSFPKIKIGNYIGPAVITVSLVCEDKPYRVHPNGIVGKKKVSEEDFTYIYVKKVLVTRENCVIQFKDLGIRFVKTNQVEEALQLRKTQGVDPFKQGYKFSPESYNLQAVRLCFEVSLVTQQLDPVVSNVIFHLNKFVCLNIKRMSECSGKKSGGPDIIFLSRKLNPKDVEVVFYEKENNKDVWEACGEIIEVYERSAIVCTTPPYTRAGVPRDTEVTLNVALRRRSDRERGDPRLFTYSADDTDVRMKKRKMLSKEIQQYTERNWTPPASLKPDAAVSQYDQDWQKMPQSLDFNLVTLGPSFVNSSTPEPSFVDPVMLGLNSANLTTPGPFNFNAVRPRSNSLNPAMLEPMSVTPGVSAPNHVTPAEPGLSSINSFLPGPSLFELMETPLTPDMDVMSLFENEVALSPNGYLDKDGGIPSVDTALADACVKLLDF